MPRMMIVIPETYYTPLVDVSDLSDQQAGEFFDKCAQWLDENSNLFFDNMSIERDGILYTRTPLTPIQLEKFRRALEIK